MSLAEIKQSVAQMTLEERLEIAALIAHLNRAADPKFRQELDTRMTSMDNGKKVSAEKLQAIHEGISRRGR
ncbi:MAG TPA: hypothetical protein VGE41_00670 [Verrucomicrobiae bacterium]|jgi:hypothetical protein